jgi:hypothetical protein
MNSITLSPRGFLCPPARTLLLTLAILLTAFSGQVAAQATVNHTATL